MYDCRLGSRDNPLIFSNSNSEACFVEVALIPALDALLIANGFVLLEPRKDIVWIVRVFACGTDNLLLPYIVFEVAVEKTSSPFLLKVGVE